MKEEEMRSLGFEVFHCFPLFYERRERMNGNFERSSNGSEGRDEEIEGQKRNSHSIDLRSLASMTTICLRSGRSVLCLRRTEGKGMEGRRRRRERKYVVLWMENRR